jgi:bifunctional DNA-binding transcriptional regulator/antitoxin component of YhaV-PrlF toxin-antitoxin module
VDSDGEYFITFPDDLLEAANLSPGEEVEWVEKEVGTFLLRKITKPLGMGEC